MQALRSIAYAAAIGICFLSNRAEARIHRSSEAIAQFKREHPCPANGNRYGPCPGWQIDHKIPLKCDGADHPVNMQWLTVEEHKKKTSREARWCRK